MTQLRALAAASRRFADSLSERLADATSKQVIATVTTVTPGAAADGNALVAVTWRGTEATVNGYADSYTPAVGHRVVCAYIDNQLLVQHRIVGYP